ncbi:3634_t:CDS:2 [Ambispora leptoticha]|uniref:3634_t:CDS:1 n=1 Tax=Ambispora leptoticha TaxID=144679 RepID=A0A9N9A0N8_9GLOM|nr:3634_t:CDS:2 [Ambispora leptoticha]
MKSKRKPSSKPQQQASEANGSQANGEKQPPTLEPSTEEITETTPNESPEKGKHVKAKRDKQQVPEANGSQANGEKQSPTPKPSTEEITETTPNESPGKGKHAKAKKDKKIKKAKKKPGLIRRLFTIRNIFLFYIFYVTYACEKPSKNIKNNRKQSSLISEQWICSNGVSQYILEHEFFQKHVEPRITVLKKDYVEPSKKILAKQYEVHVKPVVEKAKPYVEPHVNTVKAYYAEYVYKPGLDAYHQYAEEHIDRLYVQGGDYLSVSQSYYDRQVLPYYRKHILPYLQEGWKKSTEFYSKFIEPTAQQTIVTKKIAVQAATAALRDFIADRLAKLEQHIDEHIKNFKFKVKDSKIAVEKVNSKVDIIKTSGSEHIHKLEKFIDQTKQDSTKDITGKKEAVASYAKQILQALKVKVDEEKKDAEETLASIKNQIETLTKEIELSLTKQEADIKSDLQEFLKKHEKADKSNLKGYETEIHDIISKAISNFKELESTMVKEFSESVSLTIISIKKTAKPVAREVYDAKTGATKIFEQHLDSKNINEIKILEDSTSETIVIQKSADPALDLLKQRRQQQHDPVLTKLKLGYKKYWEKQKSPVEENDDDDYAEELEECDVEGECG